MTTAPTPDEHRCEACPAGRRRPTHGAWICPRCEDDARERLAEIVWRLARLTAVPQATGLDGGRGSPGYGSRPPADVHALALSDGRSVPDPGRGGVYAAPAVLRGWAAVLWRAGRLRSRPGPLRTLADVQAAASLLDAHGEWIARQPWAAHYVADVRRTATQLRSATGDPGPKPVGYCTADVEDPADGSAVPCAAPLFVPRSGTTLACRHCGAEYDGLALIELAARQGADEAGETTE